MNVEEIYYEITDFLMKKYLNQSLDIYVNSTELDGHTFKPLSPSAQEVKAGEILLRKYIIEIKIRMSVELFVRSGYTLSDVQIAQLVNEARSKNSSIPAISRSSADRYLKDERIRTYYSDDIYREILEKRRANLLAAKSKGGLSYAENNVPVFDEMGKFAGSIKK